jgi:hypothetical protein
MASGVVINFLKHFRVKVRIQISQALQCFETIVEQVLIVQPDIVGLNALEIRSKEFFAELIE